jgi:hypothetical protein
MAVLNIAKAKRGLPKTPALLRLILNDVTQEQAQNAWDADWNVVYVVCHLRDMEAVFTERLQMMLEQENPAFPLTNEKELAVQNRYAEADLRDALTEFEQRRRHFIALVENLTPEQWERTGMHAHFGETTVLTLAINSAIHDLDHMEQITRALGRTQTWS